MSKESKTKKNQEVNDVMEQDNSLPKVTFVNDPQEQKGEEVKEGMSYDVKFSSFPGEGSVKGVCSVTFGGEIAVKGVKVIEGSKGLFVAMPSYKVGDEYKDIVYPITKEGRQKLNEAVIGEYNNQVQAHQAAVNQDNGVGFDMTAPMGEPMNGQAPAMQ